MYEGNIRRLMQKKNQLPKEKARKNQGYGPVGSAVLESGLKFLAEDTENNLAL